MVFDTFACSDFYTDRSLSSIILATSLVVRISAWKMHVLSFSLSSLKLTSALGYTPTPVPVHVYDPSVMSQNSCLSIFNYYWGLFGGSSRLPVDSKGSISEKIRRFGINKFWNQDFSEHGWHSKILCKKIACLDLGKALTYRDF